MFDSPRKSINAFSGLSESQEELHETQPVSPASTGTLDKKKQKKKKKKQLQEKRAVSTSPLSAEDTFRCSEDKTEKACVDSDEPIIRGIFQIDKKSHDVVLTARRVTWTPIQPETPTAQPAGVPKEGGVAMKGGGVALSEVFAVKVKRRRSAGQQSGGTLLGITLFCARRKGHKLKERPLHLDNMSVDHCQLWFTHLKELLAGFRTRPRSLKVLINPVSHRKEACYIYRDHIAPLFLLADIKTSITITEKKGHAISVLTESNLDEYDGVVCVGGDGSVAEVVHGLLLRGQMEAGRDTDSAFTPVRAPLPLGLIPAGSTDVVSCSVHGVRHPVTAALHIILGHLQAVDVCSFSSQGRLRRFGCSAMFGFGGRSLALAERLRWMPANQRREVAVIRTLANLRPEDCELSFLPVKSVQQETVDHKNKSQKDDSDTEEGGWRTMHGLYLNVSVMAIPCLCSMAPRGLAPTTSLANGSMALIAVRNTSRSEFIKHLKRYNSVANQFSFSFVETHAVQAVRLRPRSAIGWVEEEAGPQDSASRSEPILASEGTFPWCIDGDLLELPSELLIRVHPQLLTLYGEEVTETDEGPVKCSCI